MKRVLITGASGLLGFNVMQVFSERHKVLGLYHSHPVDAGKGLEWREADLSEEGEIERILQEFRPNLVVHAAALTDIEACEKAPDYCRKLNFESVKKISLACRAQQVKLAHLSTDAFFDSGPGKLALETDTPKPQSIYSATKAEAEAALLEVYPEAWVVRTNIYGWNVQPKFSLAEWILDNLLHKPEVRMFRDVYYSPIYAPTLARAIEALWLGNAPGGIWHLAGKTVLSKHQFGIALAREFGLNTEKIRSISVDEMAFTAKRSKNMSLSVEKFERFAPGVLQPLEKELQAFRGDLNREWSDTKIRRELKAALS